MQVKVFNDHDEAHVEQFLGRTITIPPGGCVEMGLSEAKKFLGQFYVRRRNLSDPTESAVMWPKKLRIVADPEEMAAKLDQPIKYRHMDGTEFRTSQGLTNYENSLKGSESNGKRKSA